MGRFFKWIAKGVVKLVKSEAFQEVVLPVIVDKVKDRIEKKSDGRA